MRNGSNCMKTGPSNCSTLSCDQCCQSRKKGFFMKKRRLADNSNPIDSSGYSTHAPQMLDTELATNRNTLDSNSFVPGGNRFQYEMYQMDSRYFPTTSCYSGIYGGPNGNQNSVHPNENCSVCSSTRIELMILPCMHQFHKQCLEDCLIADAIHGRKRLQCPVCKSQILRQVPLKGRGTKLLHKQSKQVTGATKGKAIPPIANTDGALRRGKWSTEEENYANELIRGFRSGAVVIKDGTTLRNFLAEVLRCDPMRISKKFVGTQCIGKVC